MTLGKCEMCMTLGVELERLPEDCNAWPLSFACPPCAAELRDDDADPLDDESRDGCPRCGGGGCSDCLAVTQEVF